MTTELYMVSNYTWHNFRLVLGVTLSRWVDTWRNTGDSDPAVNSTNLLLSLIVVNL